MHLRPFLISLSLLVSVADLKAQVSIQTDGTDPHGSSMLDVKATNKGVLVPRVALTTGTGSAAPINPAPDASLQESLLIYNTATVGDVTPGYYYWNGTGWVRLMSGNTPPLLVEVDPTFSNGGNQTNAISRAGNLTISGSNSLIFTGGAVHNALQMGNNNITNANSITIADPGVNEGISWTGSAGPWTLDVSPLGRTNADGNFNIYGTANNIALWRPTLFISNGTNYTTATPQASGGLHFTSTGNGHLTFSPGGTGNFGIGTTGPSAKLEVVGNAIVNGNQRIIKNAHSAGANDYHLELYSNNTGSSANEVSLRFHQGGQYYGQIRYRTGGFRFTNGNDDVLTTVSTGALNSSGTVTFTTLGVATDRLIQANATGVLSASGLDPATIATTANISGTTNYVAKFTGANTVGNSQMFDNGTNVGIGNTTLGEKLHVSGNIRLGSNGTINAEGESIRIMSGVRADDTSYEWTGFYSGTTRQGIILYDGAWSGANNLTDEFSITAENSNRLTLNTQSGRHIGLMPKGTGNVGINNLAPIAKLDIQGPTSRSGTHATAQTFYVSGTLNTGQTGSAAGNIEFRHDNGTQGIGFGYNTIYATGSNATQELNLLSRGASHITLNAFAYSTGNVGIGTTGPAQKLHVVGNARVSGLSGVGNNLVYANASGDLVRSTFDISTTPQGTGTTNYLARWTPNGSTLGTGATFDNGTNVGINEAVPNAPLSIRASNTSDQGLYQSWRYQANSDTYTLRLKQTVTSGIVRYTYDMVNNNTAFNNFLTYDRGNVGIGVVNPIQRLDILTGTSSEGMVVRSATNATNVAGHIWPGSGGFVIDARLGDLSGAANLHLRTGGTDRIYIRGSNGNVGIQNNNPQAALHVTGDFYNQEIHGVTNTANQDIAFNAAVTEINTGGYATVVKGDGTGVDGSAILVVASVTVSGNTITFADGVGGYQEVNALANGIASFTVTLQRRINAGAWTSLISQSAMCGMAIGDWYLQYNNIPTMSGIKGDMFRFPNSVSISYFDTPGNGTVEYRLTFTQGGFRKNGGNYRVTDRNLTAVQIKR